MGAYLSEPVRDKVTENGENDHVNFSAVAMQGWRVNQEDAHNCEPAFMDDYSLFAVYDGHGGPEVSEYTAKYLPAFLSEILRNEHQSGCKASKQCTCGDRMKDVLQKAFLQFDDRLRSADVLKQLAEMAGKNEANNDDGGPSSEDEAEERCLLLEEATLPLEKLLHNYGLHIAVDSGTRRKGKNKSGQFVSPNLKAKNKARKLARTKDGNMPKEDLAAKLAAADEEGEPGTPPSSPANDRVTNNKKRKAHGCEASARPSQEPCTKLLKQDADLKLVNGDQHNAPGEDSSSVDEKQCANELKCEPSVQTPSSPTSKATGGSRQRSSKSESEVASPNKKKVPNEAGDAAVKNAAAPGVAAAAVAGNGPRNTESPETATAPPSSGEDDEQAQSAAVSKSHCAAESRAKVAPVEVGGAKQRCDKQVQQDDDSEDDDDFVMKESEEGTSSSATSDSEQQADSEQRSLESGSKKRKHSQLHACWTAAKQRIARMHGSEHEAGGGGDSTHSQSGSESGADSAAAGSGSDTENSDDDDRDELEEEGVDDDQLDSSLEEDEVGGDQCDLHVLKNGITTSQPGEDSGTTACVALVHSNKHLFVANIGDSRAVVGSSGGRVPVELSADHKPEDEVELKRIQAAGGRVTADGRVNGGLNLSRAFG